MKEILSIETAKKLADYEKMQQRLNDAIQLIKGSYFYTGRLSCKTVFNQFVNELLKKLEGDNDGI